MINANLSPQRKSGNNPSTRIMSIRNVVNQSQSAGTLNLKQSELNKLQKLKAQIENVKEKAQNHLHSDFQDLKQKKPKYKLNIDTDSEEETSQDNLNTSNNKTQRDNLGNNQKGYIDAQMTLGAEQTKAKQNTNILFNCDIKIPAKTNLKKIIQVEKNPIVQTSSLNNQVTLSNQGSQTVNYAQHLNEGTTANLKGNQKTSITQGLNNSYYEETGVTEENLSYLKGLTQNQNLPNNCELSEYVENDRISISIKTTDFFTFIRLQDEVDELRRKHQEFQLQKQLIQQQQKQQMIAMSKTNIEPEAFSPTNFNQQNSQKGNGRLHGSGSLKNLNTSNSQKNIKPSTYIASQSQEKNNVSETEKEGKNIYTLYFARKLGLRWHQKTTKLLRERTIIQSMNQDSKSFQKRHSIDSNYHSSGDEINNTSHFQN